jgi:hypothetical protein
MAGSLEGPLDKWTRAQAHLGRLSEEIRGVFPSDKAWPVRTEPARSGREYRFYLRDLPSVETDWVLSAGETMFNLRAALDYLAYELHLRHFRGNLPRSVEGITQFPIYDRPDDFRRNFYRIEKLSRRDRKALGHLQPYVARHDKWLNTRYWLSRLNALHNVDKHRKLHLVTASLISAPFPEMDPALGFESNPTWGAVEPESEVDHWTFVKPPADIEPHPGVRIQVVLEHRGEWVELTRLLGRCASSALG